jgi:putative mRNA 3-end processing factor
MVADGVTWVVAEIWDWWQANARAGATSVLGCYALGKAQRVLAELLRYTDRSVYVHGAVAALTDVYREAGVAMVPTLTIEKDRKDYAGELIVARPGDRTYAAAGRRVIELPAGG